MLSNSSNIWIYIYVRNHVKCLQFKINKVQFPRFRSHRIWLMLSSIYVWFLTKNMLTQFEKFIIPGGKKFVLFVILFLIYDLSQMLSLTTKQCVRAKGRWWKAEEPGVLQFMGLQSNRTTKIQSTYLLTTCSDPGMQDYRVLGQISHHLMVTQVR